MKYQIELAREADETWVAEIVGLPGVLAWAVERPHAVRFAIVLALRVVAERFQHHEVEETADGAYDVEFVPDQSGRSVIDVDALKAEANRRLAECVSSSVLEQVSLRIFDPVQDAAGGVRNAVAESLNVGGPPTPAARVREDLRRLGWREKRQSLSHTTFSRNGAPDLTFPFRDDETLRPELVRRIVRGAGLSLSDFRSE